MMKKFYIITMIILIHLSHVGISFSKINIIASVNNEIITNYDVLKESRYLKILSPTLDNINEKDLKRLATQSLIKEIIKKKEISKFLEINNENMFVDEYLENLLTKLKFKNKDDFINILSKSETYTFDEIRSKIKIELFWNELIFNKYNNQIVIDETEIINKVNNIEGEIRKEFFLSEIVFKKKVDEKINVTITKIKKSIDEIGFKNTATIYSVSNSSKFGGEIGWIKEDTLSREVFENIANLKPNEYSDIIKINDNFIILKINDIKIVKNKVNKQEAIKKLIQTEKNKKLEKFSRIYFNKVQAQYSINEK